MEITVRQAGTARHHGILTFDGEKVNCALGRGGIAEKQREGDGITPAGRWHVRALWHRPDRQTCGGVFSGLKLSVHEIDPDAGWSDDPADPLYNQPVHLPHAFGHEKLWRADRLYDVFLPLGFNDAPPLAGRGSAIFFHLASIDFAPTQGCVAVAPDVMQKIIPLLTPDSVVHILQEEK